MAASAAKKLFTGNSSPKIISMAHSLNADLIMHTFRNFLVNIRFGSQLHIHIIIVIVAAGISSTSERVCNYAMAIPIHMGKSQYTVSFVRIHICYHRMFTTCLFAQLKNIGNDTKVIRCILKFS